MVLVIRRLCLVQVQRSSRPWLLHFLVPCLSSTPSQEVMSCPILALKSPRMKSLSAVGTSRDNIFKVFIKLVFCLICVSHGGYIGADDGSKLFSVMKWKYHSHEAVIHPF